MPTASESEHEKFVKFAVLEVSFHGLGCPVLEEAEDFFAAVAFALFQEAGVLNVEDAALFVEHHEHREAEAFGVVQALQHRLGQLRLLGSLGLARVVVHVDVDEVVGYHSADGRVVGGEVRKAEAPRTPVAADLTDDELAFGLGLCECLVNLFHGVAFLVIHLLQGRLCACRQGKEGGTECK